MAEGSNAPFSGSYTDLVNLPTLPEGVTAQEATEKHTLDKKTIGLNSDDELQNQKLTEIIGDFENTLDGWTFETNSYTQSYTSNYGVYSGSEALELTGTTGNFAELKNNVDLTGVEMLKFRYEAWSSQDSRIAVKIDGSQVYSKDNNDNNAINPEIDVSSYQGETEIKFVFDASYSSGFDSNHALDGVRIVRKPFVEVEK